MTCFLFLLPAKWCRGKRSDKGDDPTFILPLSCPFQAAVLAAPRAAPSALEAASAKVRQTNAAAAPEMHPLCW